MTTMLHPLPLFGYVTLEEEMLYGTVGVVVSWKQQTGVVSVYTETGLLWLPYPMPTCSLDPAMHDGVAMTS